MKSMKQFCIILLVLIASSCNYFNVKKSSPEAILKEDLKTFNWDDVDLYPSFSVCDSLMLKHEKKLCFESTLYAEISTYLHKQDIVVSQDINDTLLLKLSVAKQGEIALLEVKIDNLTRQEIPDLEDLLLKSLEQLPEIKSAVKMGQPVTTEFELPLIVKVN